MHPQAFSEYDFSSISFEVMPAANYQETSLMKNRMSRKTIVKPVIITITERWNELAQARSLRADTSSCLAYTGGRLGLTLPVLTDPEMDIVEQRHQAPFQDYTNVLDAIDYVKAPNQDQPVKLCWMTMTCPSLFQGEYRRQMELHADTTKITEFGRIYLEDISRCLGIPSEYPELFFVLLPDSFRCYGSVYQPPPEADGN